MKKSLFVISDLHLGGASGFQICSPTGRSRLVEFIDYVATQKQYGIDIHLVLNGDIVDFLAEKEFSSFTNNDDDARTKLERIIASTSEVWDSLRRLATGGVRLTLMIGNHDTELSLPGPRQLLMDTIDGDRVEFMYDNQAFIDGPVLIEHGNRYDKWNSVSHNALRAIRSAMSRRENPIEYLGPPGSQLVKEMMNPIKERYSFVDLLKPENAGVLPILAVLEPSAMKNVSQLAALATKSSEARFDRNGIPLDQQNIAALAAVPLERDKMLELALRLAGMDDPQNISATGITKSFWERLEGAASEAARQVQLDLLLKALRAFTETHRQAFDVGTENAEYLNPANAAAAKGFKVVVFGHTHLVKRIDLATPGAVYLNTGTWADLMKVPEAILGGNETLARVQLAGFVDDLKNGRLEAWRCQVPTFVRIDFDQGALSAADIYFFEGGDKIQRVPDGRLTRLDYTGNA